MEKKNFFEAENEEQARRIVKRLEIAGYTPKGKMDDEFFKVIVYPCRFYTNGDRKIVLDYTPYGDWKTYKEFVRSWVER